MGPSVDVWRRVFISASVLWALSLPFASFAAARTAPANAWYAAAFVVYALGSVVCHQLPERSFHLWSAQMPVCARCAGIYLGGAVAAIAAAMAPSTPGADNVGGRPAMRALGVAALPTAATLLYEWTTGDTPGNWIRAIAGAPIGAVAAALVVRALQRGARIPVAAPGGQADVR